MRTDNKCEAIHQALRQRMIGGSWPPGARLPREVELAAEFGVARKTLRKALELLEKESLLDRRRGSGTFVRMEPSAGRSATVTFLLPCPDYYRYPMGYASQLIAEGALEACYRCRLRFETVAVSPENDNQQIDFERLAHLDRRSMVFAMSFWYRPLFPALNERGCRMLLINSRNYRKYGRCSEGVMLPDAFQTINLDVYGAIRQAVRDFAAAGARKIALAAPYLNVPGHANLDGYRAGLNESGLAEECILHLDRNCAVVPPFPALGTAIRKWYESARFDALVILPRGEDCVEIAEFNRAALGLPEALPVTELYFASRRSYEHPALPLATFDYRHIGMLAVDMLSDPEGDGCERNVAAIAKKAAPGLEFQGFAGIFP